MTKRIVKKCFMYIALAVALCMMAGCADNKGVGKNTVSNDEKTAQTEATKNESSSGSAVQTKKQDIEKEEKAGESGSLSSGEKSAETSDKGDSTTVTTKFQRVYTMTNMEDFEDEYFEYAPVFVVDYAPDEGWVQFDASSWLYPNSYFSTSYPVQSGDYNIQTFNPPDVSDITPVRLEYSDDSFTIAGYYTEYDSELGEYVNKLGIPSKFVWTE